MDEVIQATDRAANIELLQSHIGTLLAYARSLLEEVEDLRDVNEALVIGEYSVFEYYYYSSLAHRGSPPPQGENPAGD